MRRTLLTIVVAGVVGLLAGLAAQPLLLWAQQAGLGCWGSICQNAGGQVILFGPVSASAPISLSTAPMGLLNPGDVGLAKETAGPLAPGARVLALRARSMVGSAPGSCTLVAVSGASTQEYVIPVIIPGTTILDPTGSVGYGC